MPNFKMHFKTNLAVHFLKVFTWNNTLKGNVSIFLIRLAFCIQAIQNILIARHNPNCRLFCGEMCGGPGLYLEQAFHSQTFIANFESLKSSPLHIWPIVCAELHQWQEAETLVLYSNFQCSVIALCHCIKYLSNFLKTRGILWGFRASKVRK